MRARAPMLVVCAFCAHGGSVCAHGAAARWPPAPDATELNDEIDRRGGVGCGRVRLGRCECVGHVDLYW